MSTGDSSLVPRGERYLKENVCPQCEGRRVVVHRMVRECVKCKGQGWIREQSGPEVICPVCKGHRRLETDATVACPKCGGEGKIIAVMQDYIGQVPCGTCGGQGLEPCPWCEGAGQEECIECFTEGVVVNWEAELVTCGQCGGCGEETVKEPVKYTLAAWEKTEVALEMRSVLGEGFLEALEENEALVFKERCFVYVDRCKKCKDEDDKSGCWFCGGKSIIRIRYFGTLPCPACQGEGYLRPLKECWLCEGLGYYPCDDCNGEGTVECETCSGLGTVPGIISKEV